MPTASTPPPGNACNNIPVATSEGANWDANDLSQGTCQKNRGRASACATTCTSRDAAGARETHQEPGFPSGSHSGGSGGGGRCKDHRVATSRQHKGAHLATAAAHRRFQ